MELLAQTSARGVVVTPNACNLNAPDGTITAAATTLTLSDNLLNDGSTAIFSDGNKVTIGLEDITLTTVSGTTVSVCARGVGTTTGATHSHGMNIRLAAGTTLLSHTCGASDTLTGITAGGEGTALFAISEAGTIKRFKMSTGFVPEVFWPGTSWTPGNGVVIKVLVWVWPKADSSDDKVFWAEIQK